MRSTINIHVHTQVTWSFANARFLEDPGSMHYKEVDLETFMENGEAPVPEAGFLDFEFIAAAQVMCVYVHIYVCMCVCVYAYINIHTCIHTYIPTYTYRTCNTRAFADEQYTHIRAYIRTYIHVRPLVPMCLLMPDT